MGGPGAEAQTPCSLCREHTAAGGCLLKALQPGQDAHQIRGTCEDKKKQSTEGLLETEHLPFSMPLCHSLWGAGIKDPGKEGGVGKGGA